MKVIKRLTYSTFGSYDHVDADGGEISFTDSLLANHCPCCASTLKRFVLSIGKHDQVLNLDLCPFCGWWHLHRITATQTIEGKIVQAHWWELYHAVLTEIPLNSPSLPIDQLRLHLARRWEDRREMTAQQAEDLVSGILKEHYTGEVLRVTANALAPDGGVDLFIVSDNGLVKRAVQVKRRQTRDKEPVKDVRDFIGAMILEGSDHGVFVTTASRYSAPAIAISRNANLIKHRLSLELIDGERLLELLEHSNRQAPVTLPPYVDLDKEWEDSAGTRYKGHDLFFGNLRRLQESAET